MTLNQDTCNKHVTEWIKRFNGIVGDNATRSAAPELLFLEDSFWRDTLGLSWRLQTILGDKEILTAIVNCAKKAGLGPISLDDRASPPQIVSRAGKEAIEAFFKFETKNTRGRGILRLVKTTRSNCGETSGPQWLAWTFFTAADSIKGHEEKIGRNRPTGQSFSRDFRGPNWLDKRMASQNYEDREPQVLVVGCGQAGLSIAARLTRLGVDTLIVDKNAQIGDNWRNRYHALTLHNQLQVNHLPYMDFPVTWPTYIPKDMLALWFESYAAAMELNVWTGTTVKAATYNATTERWQVTIEQDNGTSRTIAPRHVVMATGISGIPHRPDIDTLDNFSGPVLHSSQYSDGDDWSGKRAIVIGTGNSGHDISHDLCSSGALVTMVQRSPTLVVNIEPSAQFPYILYNEDRTTEECDFITTSMPIPLVKQAHQQFTRRSRETDKELLDGLTKIGFQLDFGEDDTGWQFKYLTRGGGYYFNVGCSNLLIEGQIDLVQNAEIDYFEADGMVMKDGSKIDADLIILATGYKPQEHLVSQLFGPGVAEKVGPIWGFGDELELRNMYCQTGQPGLWFIAGSFAQCRINSKYLAFQIKAVEERLLTARRDKAA